MTKLFHRLMATAAVAALAAPAGALADSRTWGQSDYTKPWAAFRKQAPVVMKRKEIRAALKQAFPTLDNRQITTLLRSYVLQVLASVNDKGIPSLETFINRRRPRGQSTGVTRTVGGNHDGTASSRAGRIAWAADTVHLRSSATPPSSCLTATCTYSWEDDTTLPNPHHNRAHSGVAFRRAQRDINGQMREIPLDPAILAPFKGSVYYYGRAASNWPMSINTDGTWEGSTAMNAGLKIDFDTLELTGGLYSTVSGGPTFDLSKVHLLNDRQLSGSCSCSGGWEAVQRPDGLWVRNSKTVFEGDYTLKIAYGDDGQKVIIQGAYQGQLFGAYEIPNLVRIITHYKPQHHSYNGKNSAVLEGTNTQVLSYDQVRKLLSFWSGRTDFWAERR